MSTKHDPELTLEQLQWIPPIRSDMTVPGMYAHRAMVSPVGSSPNAARTSAAGALSPWKRFWPKLRCMPAV